MATLDITYNVILPIFIVVGLSAFMDHLFEIDPRTLSRLLIYLFSPAIVFHSLALMEITADEAGSLVGTILITSLLVGLSGYGIARLVGFDRRLESAFTLSVVLINAGNYGIPLARLAFGTAGEARAVLCYVTSALMAYTVGVFLASRGTMPTHIALLNTLKNPMPYAAALGLIVNATGLYVPPPLMDSADLMAQAAVPIMLTVLGIQLSRSWKNSLRGKYKVIAAATALRLMLAPLIAFPLTALLGISGLTRDVAIVQVSMPTAVLAGVLATEFGSDAEHVTATILISTLTSIVTLSVLLSILGGV